MRRVGIAVRVLLVIALAGLGLPAGAGVQAQGDFGLVAVRSCNKRQLQFYSNKEYNKQHWNN